MPVSTDRIRHFIRDNFLLENDSPLSDDDSFLEHGILDSTAILELISYLEQEYGVAVSPGELIPENFDSVRRIADFLEKKLPESKIARQAAFEITLPDSSVRSARLTFKGRNSAG